MTQSKTDIGSVFDNAWSDVDFRFEIKAQEVATDLARALHESGMSRTELCEKLDWKPSRMSKVLGGGANLTLKTLHQLCEAIGMEFDLILRRPQQARSPQPWEERHLQQDIRRLHNETVRNNTQSHAMLQAVHQLNRNAWRRTSELDQLTRAGHVYSRNDMIREARG